MSGSFPSDLDPTPLREKYYNATIIDRIDVHEDLARFRIRPDDGFEPFEPGQYVAIGVGRWEKRLDGSQADPLDEKTAIKMARRAYSISCPMLQNGELADVNSVDFLEFYVVLVRQASTPDGKTPLLTPRLFRMNIGDRIEVQKKIVGHYTLEGVNPDSNVLMIGTGTGEAPHNAMAVRLLTEGHRGKIVHVTTVRQKRDLGYAPEQQHLEERFSNYRYVALTTRDPENLDPAHPGYVGKRYIQEAYSSGWLAKEVDNEFLPSNTHVFLCGNPAMIGYAPPGAAPPTGVGMLGLLRENGFTDPSQPENHDIPPGPGVIRFEKYW